MHTHTNRPNTWSLDWVLSHWAHFTMLRFIYVYMYFVYMYFLLMCSRAWCAQCAAVWSSVRCIRYKKSNYLKIMHMMIREIIPDNRQRVQRCPLQNVTTADILISSVKVRVAPTLAEADRCSWDRWLALNNRRQSIGPKPDSRPCLEGARFQVCDKAAHVYSGLPYHSVTHTLAHIINQTPLLPGLVQWACYKKASVIQSRLEPCPKEKSSIFYLLHVVVQYGDGAGNTVEENSSVFSLIQMR